MNELVYKLLRKATVKEYKEECMGKLLEISHLDYRTIKSMIRIIDNEMGLTPIDIEQLIDPEFYTFKNMVMAAKDGFYDIIPIRFFEDEKWLEEAKVTHLPIDFVKGYKRIKTFIIRPQIDIINGFAFAKCANLEHIIITGNPHSIGAYAFRDCPNLIIDYLPDKLETLGRGCFKNCTSIEEINLPDSLKYINDECFKGCTSLYGVNARDGGIGIGNEAFAGCSSLRDINATVTQLGKESFAGCSKLSHIELNVDEIPKAAFAGCRALKRMVFDGKTPSRIHREATIGCDSLKNIYSTGFAYQLRESDGFYSLAQNTIENRKRSRPSGQATEKDFDAKHLIANRLARTDNIDERKYAGSETNDPEYLELDIDDDIDENIFDDINDSIIIKCKNDTYDEIDSKLISSVNKENKKDKKDNKDKSKNGEPGTEEKKSKRKTKNNKEKTVEKEEKGKITEEYNGTDITDDISSYETTDEEMLDEYIAPDAENGLSSDDPEYIDIMNNLDSLETFFVDIWDDYIEQKWNEERDKIPEDDDDGFVYKKSVHSIIGEMK